MFRPNGSADLRPPAGQAWEAINLEKAVETTILTNDTKKTGACPRSGAHSTGELRRTAKALNFRVFRTTMRESFRSVRKFFTTDEHGFTRMLALLIRVHRCSSVVDFFWLRPQAALGLSWFQLHFQDQWR
jgi:hypothetical protein